MIQRTVSPDEIAALGCVLIRDKDFAPETLIERLFAGGYVREEPIFGPGQLSVRGGIVDVWSPDADSPVRVEFFGDTVESIRSFDPETQRTSKIVQKLTLMPISEVGFGGEADTIESHPEA